MRQQDEVDYGFSYILNKQQLIFRVAKCFSSVLNVS